MELLTKEERQDTVRQATHNLPIPRSPHIEEAVAKAQRKKDAESMLNWLDKNMYKRFDLNGNFDIDFMSVYTELYYELKAIMEEQ